VFGKLLDFKPYVNELKIYKGGEHAGLELLSESDNMNRKI
jgi:hypothetical protein